MMVMPFTCARTSNRRFTLLKVFKRGSNLFLGDSAARRQRRRRRRIPSRCIRRRAKTRNRPIARRLRNTDHVRARRIKLQIRHLPIACLRVAVSLHRTECPRQTTLDTLPGIEGNDAATPRNQVHQALESRLHCIEIFVNVRMIELNRSEDDRVGKVVQEFRTLVEEGGIVLIAFEDEVLPLPELKTAAEIFGDAADQK